MSIDMSQFHGVFFEESQEHLNDMEHLLMGLQVEYPDPEDLNSIFRAAHSIKGGSGIFGFEALTGLTHIMENLLDNARQGELQMTTAIVDTLLKTVDILRSILEAYKVGGDIDWGAIKGGTKQLEEHLSTETDTTDIEKAEAEQGFGFFTDKPSEEEAAFGFFDEQKGSDEEQAFGFFEPEGAEAESEAFGFFEPIDEEEKKDGSIVPPEPAKSTSKPTSARESKSPKVEQTQGKDTSSIRVDTNKIDSLVNLVGQLVITQSKSSTAGGPRQNLRCL